MRVTLKPSVARRVAPSLFAAEYLVDSSRRLVRFQRLPNPSCDSRTDVYPSIGPKANHWSVVTICLGDSAPFSRPEQSRFFRESFLLADWLMMLVVEDQIEGHVCHPRCFNYSQPTEHEAKTTCSFEIMNGKGLFSLIFGIEGFLFQVNLPFAEGPKNNDHKLLIMRRHLVPLFPFGLLASNILSYTITHDSNTASAAKRLAPLYSVYFYQQPSDVDSCLSDGVIRSYLCAYMKFQVI